jgi:putative NADH-flavin reductase
MNIIIFGASRGVGRCLVERALADGHTVTAVARGPVNSTAPHARLRAVRCDVRDTASVCATVAGHDVIFGTLGSGSRKSAQLYAAGARSMLEGMEKHGIRRLIFLSNFGVLGEEGQGLRQKALLMLASYMLRDTLADHQLALNEIRRRAREWVVVRPLALTNGPSTGRYRLSADNLPAGGTQISRFDVADFMLRQATEDRYLGAVPAIAY